MEVYLKKIKYCDMQNLSKNVFYKNFVNKKY